MCLEYKAWMGGFSLLAKSYWILRFNKTELLCLHKKTTTSASGGDCPVIEELREYFRPKFANRSHRRGIDWWNYSLFWRHVRLDKVSVWKWHCRAECRTSSRLPTRFGPEAIWHSIHLSDSRHSSFVFVLAFTVSLSPGLAGAAGEQHRRCCRPFLRSWGWHWGTASPFLGSLSISRPQKLRK